MYGIHWKHTSTRDRVGWTVGGDCMYIHVVANVCVAGPETHTVIHTYCDTR